MHISQEAQPHDQDFCKFPEGYFLLWPSSCALNSYLYFISLPSMVFLLLHLNSCMELGFFSLIWSQTTYHMPPLCSYQGLPEAQVFLSHLRNINNLNLKMTTS